MIGKLANARRAQRAKNVSTRVIVHLDIGTLRRRRSSMLVVLVWFSCDFQSTLYCPFLNLINRRLRAQPRVLPFPQQPRCLRGISQLGSRPEEYLHRNVDSAKVAVPRDHNRANSAVFKRRLSRPDHHLQHLPLWGAKPSVAARLPPQFEELLKLPAECSFRDSLLANG